MHRYFGTQAFSFFASIRKVAAAARIETFSSSYIALVIVTMVGKTA